VRCVGHGGLGGARAKPSNLWCGDDEARDVVEQLNRDAGYEPIYAGGLENAGSQESFIGLVFAIARVGSDYSCIAWRRPTSCGRSWGARRSPGSCFARRMKVKLVWTGGALLATVGVGAGDDGLERRVWD
jgi:hypothetical protein